MFLQEYYKRQCVGGNNSTIEGVRIFEGLDRNRQDLGSMLVSQFIKLGVEVEEDSEVSIKLGKLLRFTPPGVMSMVHRNSLAPILIVCTLFDYAPIKRSKMLELMKIKRDLWKGVAEGFPVRTLNYYVSKEFFRKHSLDLLEFGTVNVKDLVDFCKNHGLSMGVLEL